MATDSADEWAPFELDGAKIYPSKEEAEFSIAVSVSYCMGGARGLCEAEAGHPQWRRLAIAHVGSIWTRAPCVNGL